VCLIRCVGVVLIVSLSAVWVWNTLEPCRVRLLDSVVVIAILVIIICIIVDVLSLIVLV
jgi:hypothetical protein